MTLCPLKIYQSTEIILNLSPFLSCSLPPSLPATLKDAAGSTGSKPTTVMSKACQGGREGGVRYVLADVTEKERQRGGMTGGRDGGKGGREEE